MRILTENSQNLSTAPTSPYTLEVPRTTNSQQRQFSDVAPSHSCLLFDL
jgi:hypothetical protein